MPNGSDDKGPVIIGVGGERDIVESYKRVMEVTKPGLLHRFNRRLSENPGSARLEAFTYAVLENVYHLTPTIFEDLSTGGADFEGAHRYHSRLFVEVKYLDRQAVTGRSGLPDRVETGAGWFGMITPKIQSVVGDAASQLADLPGPGICVVGTDQANADLVMGTHAVSCLLTSDTVIQIPINSAGGQAGSPQVMADLSHSAFARLPESPREGMRAMRQSVSAVILMTFDYDGGQAHLVGCLHPEARRPLDYRVFPRVPFARFRQVPMPGGVAEVEFVVADPSPHGVFVLPAGITDRHLR